MSLDLNTREVVPWVCFECRALAIFLPPTWLALVKKSNPRWCVCKRCLT